MKPLRNRWHQVFWLCAAVLAVTMLNDSASAQPTAEQQSAIRSNCRSDFMSKCSGVTPGGKDALLCLQKNVASLSAACQTAVSATIPAPAPTKPVQAAPAPAAPAAVTAAPPAPAAAAISAARCPAAPEKPAVAATAPPPAAKPANAAKPVKKPSEATAAPTPLAPSPPAQTAVALSPIEPVVPLAKIEAMPLPERLAVIRSCRYDQDAVCSSVKTGGGRVIACLAAHPRALSPPCRTALDNALR
jgi:hypothetical protein